MYFTNIMKERIIDRLDRYMKYKHLSDNKVTKNAGLYLGVFNRSREEGRDLSAGAALKILDCYPDLSKEWLLNGEGDMIITPTDIYNRLLEVFKLQGIDAIVIEDAYNIIKGTFKRATINSNMDIAKKWVDIVYKYFDGKYSYSWLLYGQKSIPTDNNAQKIEDLEAEIAKLKEDNRKMINLLDKLAK